MTKQKVVLTLGFMAIAGGVSFYLFTSTPKYAFYEIVYAVKTKNREKFEKRVDVDAIASQFVDEMVAEFNHNGNNRVGAIAQLIKGKVGEAVHQSIDQTLFEKGEANSTKDSGGFGAGMLSPLGGARKEIAFKGVGETTHDGDMAITKVSFSHEKLQKDIVLDMKMKKQNGLWRLVQIGGLMEAFKELRQVQPGSNRQVTEAPPAEIQPSAPKF